LFDFTEDYKIPGSLDLSGVKLFFLPNPNSPSGTVLANDEIRRLCGSFSGILVVDEAYADFAEDNAISLLQEFDNLIITRTFSKSYSLAGLRIGLGLASEYFVGNMLKVKDSYNLDRLAQAAACAALDDQDNLKKNTSLIVATRERLKKELETLGAFVYPSQANFVLARFPGNKAKELYLSLLEKNIFVRYFADQRRD
ncbi:MAG: aminotransferase class I/II-fold pyridoxal phosphate-dependent enzyme, partial [Planctomycetota bacterium]